METLSNQSVSHGVCEHLLQRLAPDKRKTASRQLARLANRFATVPGQPVPARRILLLPRVVFRFSSV